MKELVLIRYGEIALKGGNRSFFIGRLKRNIHSALRGIEHSLIVDRGRILVQFAEDFQGLEDALVRLKKVFGIVSLSRVIKVEKDFDTIKQSALEMMNKKRPSTFKIECKRADKSFPMKSPEICRSVGAYILENVENTKVDVHTPELLINIEIRDYTYIYAGFERGSGGLPTGTGGKGLLLLSGGIDSPVAGWMIAKRGIDLEGVHFHSFPFTSERAKEKVIDLAKVLAGYTGRLKLHLVSFTDIQNDIARNCPAEQGTILVRRFMMKIAERIAKETGAYALITGESLGQVASQTLESLYVTDASVNLPVFRPLIGMDKVEIIEKSRAIGTYELSILPYEDCCTLFLPEYPETRPRLEKILQSESHLDAELFVRQAVKTREILNL